MGRARSARLGRDPLRPEGAARGGSGVRRRHARLGRRSAEDLSRWDHIRGDGSVDRTEWSYNQGAVLAAYRLLYGISGDGAYLRRAESIADRTLATFSSRWSNGEPPEFAAIFFRRLLALADVDHRADYVAAAQAYADRLWTSPRPRLFDQAALVQLYAALAARAGA